MQPTIHIGIPAMDELQTLSCTLQCVEKQIFTGNIRTYICVNQPEWWHNDNEKSIVCQHNAELLQMLQNTKKLTVIDKSSVGNGWQTKKKSGVGMARQTLLNTILAQADENDIFVSMDADCTFSGNYISSVAKKLVEKNSVCAVNSPYYHSLTGNNDSDRGLLRYEIYMRVFLLNMLRIGSPFAFTAFGSAIACPIKTCKAIGNFDAHQAGEDFYFLQKIAKHGKIFLSNEEIVRPSSRLSERVPFGTGQAIKLIGNDNRTYPIFHHSYFDKIANAYFEIDNLHHNDIQNELFDFLQDTSNNTPKNIWTSVRENSQTLTQFKRMFHQKCDGLRIFQFLRRQAELHPFSDENALVDFLNNFYPAFELPKDFSLQNSSVSTLSNLRDFLFVQEQEARQQHDRQLIRNS